MGFIERILEWLAEFWPIRVIDAGCQGILYKQDGTAKCLTPGWHLFIPRLQRIEEVNVQYQNVDCGLQSLTTKDGMEISISLNVGYRIADVALLYTSYQHFDSSLINMARGHAAEIVCETAWADLMEDPQGFASEIQEALTEDLGEDILQVEDVTADQLSKARTYRFLQSNSLF